MWPSGATIPVSGVSLVALFPVQICVDPGCMCRLDHLCDLMCFFPVPLLVPPESRQQWSGIFRRMIGIEAAPEFLEKHAGILAHP